MAVVVRSRFYPQIALVLALFVFIGFSRSYYFRFLTDLPPMVKWTAAIIAGGGVAGITQGLTAMLRAKSTVFTGGLGNSAVATAELGGASLISILALTAPIAALALVILFFWLAFRLIRSLARRSDQPNAR